MSTTYYRYNDVVYAPPADEWGDHNGPGRSDITLSKFEVTKRTPKGVRLDNGRLVLDSSRNKYAYPSVQEALHGFIARKKSQRRILAAKQRHVDKVITLAERRLKEESL